MGVADVDTEPLDNRQQGELVAVDKSVTHGTTVAEGEKQRQGTHGRVVWLSAVDDVVEGLGVAAMSEVGLPNTLLLLASAVVGNGDVGALASEVKSGRSLNAALALVLLGIVFLNSACDESLHFLLALLLAVRLVASQASTNAKHARLHADGKVAVHSIVLIACGDDLCGEDGRGVLDCVDGVPARGFKHLDVAVKTARYETLAIGRQAQRRNRLLVVCNNGQRLCCNKIQDGNVLARGSRNGCSRRERQHGLDGSRVLKGHDWRRVANAGVPDLHGRVVTSRDNHVGHGSGQIASRADVILVARKGCQRVVVRQVPESHGSVVAGTKEMRLIAR